ISIIQVIIQLYMHKYYTQPGAKVNHSCAFSRLSQHEFQINLRGKTACGIFSSHQFTRLIL
ncbi:MAG: hypothetical protein IIX72_04400, partial [Oscillospiraceae bacterium]|nr:hypothetical protein [Oscillospiraceae bacterium]